MGIQYNPSIVTTGLVMCLDAINMKSFSGTGTVWNDLSGNNNNGTLTNSPTYNAAGYFTFTEASTQLVAFANNPSLQFLNTAAYTLECWVKITALPAANTWRRVIQRESNPGTGRDGYNFWINGAANGTDIQFYSERFVLGTQTMVGVNLPFASTGSAWNQWVITYSGSELRMYRNGSLVSGPTADARNISNNTATFVIGNQGGSAAIGGNVASVKVYNIALSAAQVQQNFAANRGRFGI